MSLLTPTCLLIYNMNIDTCCVFGVAHLPIFRHHNWMLFCIDLLADRTWRSQQTTYKMCLVFKYSSNKLIAALRCPNLKARNSFQLVRPHLIYPPAQHSPHTLTLEDLTLMIVFIGCCTLSIRNYIMLYIDFFTTHFPSRPPTRDLFALCQ